MSKRKENNGNGNPSKLRRTGTLPLPAGTLNSHGNPAHNPNHNRYRSNSFYKSFQVCYENGLYCSRSVLSEPAFLQRIKKERDNGNAIVLVKRDGPNRNISEVKFVSRTDFDEKRDNENIIERNKNETLSVFLDRENKSNPENWTILAFNINEQYWITRDKLNEITNQITLNDISINELTKDRVRIHDELLDKLEEARQNAQQGATGQYTSASLLPNKSEGGRRTKRNKRSKRSKTRRSSK